MDEKIQNFPSICLVIVVSGNSILSVRHVRHTFPLTIAFRVCHNTFRNSPVIHVVGSHNVHVPARSTIRVTFPSANVNSVLPRLEQLVIAYYNLVQP